MPKYQIVAVVETDDPLSENEMKHALNEVRESSFTWDAGTGGRFKGPASDLPVSMKRIDGKHALTDEAVILT